MTALPAQLVVIAKAPLAGRVKTRLTPPFTPVQAAGLAAAALADTLHAAARAPYARRILALDGDPADGQRGLGSLPRAAAPAAPAWPPPGFAVAGQRGDGLDERIAAAMSDAHARLPVPVVLIGMDTPQVNAGLLTAAARDLASGAADAVLGPAEDGGYWLLGLREPDPALVVGVPMSSPETGRAQLARLRRSGLTVSLLPALTDVDTAADAWRVAGEAPGSRFAAVMRDLCHPPAGAAAGLLR